MVGKVTNIGKPSTSCHFTTSKQQHKNKKYMLCTTKEHAGCYVTTAYNIMRNHEQVSPLNTQHWTGKKQWLFKVICSMRRGKNVVHCHCIIKDKTSQQIYSLSCIMLPWRVNSTLAQLGILQLSLDIQVSEQTKIATNNTGYAHPSLRII